MMTPIISAPVVLYDYNTSCGKRDFADVIKVLLVI